MLLLILTVFVMIGYMVLVRDIWGGNVAILVGDELDMTQSNQVQSLLRPRVPSMRPIAEDLLTRCSRCR